MIYPLRLDSTVNTDFRWNSGETVSGGTGLRQTFNCTNHTANKSCRIAFKSGGVCYWVESDGNSINSAPALDATEGRPALTTPTFAAGSWVKNHELFCQCDGKYNTSGEPAPERCSGVSKRQLKKKYMKKAGCCACNNNCEGDTAENLQLQLANKSVQTDSKVSLSDGDIHYAFAYGNDATTSQSVSSTAMYTSSARGELELQVLNPNLIRPNATDDGANPLQWTVNFTLAGNESGYGSPQTLTLWDTVCGSSSVGSCLSGTGGNSLYLLRKLDLENSTCVELVYEWQLSDSLTWGAEGSCDVTQQGTDNTTPKWTIGVCLAPWVDSENGVSRNCVSAATGCTKTAITTQTITVTAAATHITCTDCSPEIKVHAPNNGMVAGLLPTAANDSFNFTDDQRQAWMDENQHRLLDIGDFPQTDCCKTGCVNEPASAVGTNTFLFGDQQIKIEITNTSGINLEYNILKSGSEYIPSTAAGTEVCQSPDTYNVAWWLNVSASTGTVNALERKQFWLSLNTSPASGAEPLHPGVYKCNLDITETGSGTAVQSIECRMKVPDSSVNFDPGRLTLG